MGIKFFIVVQLLVCTIYIFQLYFYIRNIKIANSPYSLKHFYWYPIIGLLVGLCYFMNFILNAIPNEVRANVNTVSLLFHFVFLSNIIYKETGYKPFFKILLVLFSVVLCVFILASFTIRGANSFAFANGCLFIFCIFYYNQIISKSTIPNLFKDPIFILISGVFVCSGMVIPFYFIQQYLIAINTSMNMLYNLAAVSSMGYLIMNLFFLKAMIIISKSQ